MMKTALCTVIKRIYKFGSKHDFPRLLPEMNEFLQVLKVLSFIPDENQFEYYHNLET